MPSPHVCGTPASATPSGLPQGVGSPPRYMPRKPSALAVFTRQSVLETRPRGHQCMCEAAPDPLLPPEAPSCRAPLQNTPSPHRQGTHAPQRPPGPPLLAPPHWYLHPSVCVCPMLVLKSSLGQVDGEHTGHPHEPRHASIDEFCCDAGSREEGAQGERGVQGERVGVQRDDHQLRRCKGFWEGCSPGLLGVRAPPSKPVPIWGHRWTQLPARWNFISEFR